MITIDLTTGWFPVTAVVVALVALLCAVARPGRALRRQLLVGVPLTGALVGLAAILVDGLALIPYQFPNSYYLWMGLVVLAVVWVPLGWRPRSVRHRILGPLAVVLTLLMAFTLVNQEYAYYPTSASLFGQEAQHEVDAPELAQAQQDWVRTRQLPDHGFTVQVPIPGTTSGFTARAAFVWLPPAWVAAPTPSLPVIELLEGSPGSPSDWTRAAYADRTSSEYARAHDGRAPIVVMPDSNGSTDGDTECVDSKLGRAETYLTVDVPAFVRATYGAATGPRTLAVAGLSEGGTCATMLALRHPDLYTAFADFSGLAAPTLGETVDEAATTRALFGGSVEAYLAHDPRHLLQTQRFPQLSGWFATGTSDTQPLAAQRELVPLARAAGIDTCADESPGGHDFTYWTTAFGQALPWLAGHLGTGSVPQDPRCST